MGPVRSHLVQRVAFHQGLPSVLGTAWFAIRVAVRPSAVAARALDPDQADGPEPAQPLQQPAIRIGDDDRTIRHGTCPAPLQTKQRNIRICRQWYGRASVRGFVHAGGHPFSEPGRDRWPPPSDWWSTALILNRWPTFGPPPCRMPS